jgi:thiamine kinase-like enzyme
MLKESLHQLKSVDWVTKTTYLEVTQESVRDNSFIKNSKFYNKRENNIQEYINEVKPFHSKVVDTKQFSKTSVSIGVEINESIELTTTTLILTVTEDDEILTTENGKVMPIEYADDIVTSSLTEI